MKITKREEIKTVLDSHIGKRVSLTCQVGVCIWGVMFTLENGHGLCQYDLTAPGEIRIGISHQIVSSVESKLDGTLSIVIN